MTPRKRPRQERSRETVAVILEAAAQLFGTYGYAATTTNKIAERAGVSIGSLYQYFPNKDALLIALAEEHLREATEEVTGTLESAASRHTTVEGLLREVVIAVAAPHTGHPGLHTLLFTHAARVPELVERFREAERTMAAAIAVPLRGLGAGGPDPELTALLLVQGLAAQLHGAALAPPPGRTADDCVEAMLALWTRALTPSARGGRATRREE